MNFPQSLQNATHPTTFFEKFFLFFIFLQFTSFQPICYHKLKIRAFPVHLQYWMGLECYFQAKENLQMFPSVRFYDSFFIRMCYTSSRTLSGEIEPLERNTLCKIVCSLLCCYSRYRLMGSRIMVSIGLWNQIYPDFQVPTYSVIPNTVWSLFTYLYHLGNGISYGFVQTIPVF